MMIKGVPLVLVLVGVVGVAGCQATNQQADESAQVPPRTEVPAEVPAFDARNASFTVDGVPITLTNGVANAPAGSSSASATTRYLGNETKGDLNADGREDVAFWVSRETGGSGMFYYVVVALNGASGYKTTNAFLVGDRIAPQTLQIRSDARELHVNYADRRKGEPMTASPTEPRVLLLKVTASGVLEGLMR
jgi:hypothetical protein